MHNIEQAITLLKNGKLVAIPTETVYGLAADAKNPAAVQKIYTVKGRPTTNPLIIHIPNSDAMRDWAIHIPDAAFQLAESFWPGPLTLVLSRHPDVPKIVTGGQETVALRVPNHPLTLELLKQFGGGIAAPSANRYGRISPTTSAHVKEGLGTEVDYILEGGPCYIGIESTIVSLTSSIPIILRQGSISSKALSTILGKSVLDHVQQNSANIPGGNHSHYAPLQPLYLLTKKALLEMAKKLTAKQSSFSVLSFFEKPSEFNLSPSNWICASQDPKQYAQELYHHLHQLDKTAGTCILVEMPPNTEEWLAVTDRLQRASAPIK